MPKLTYNWENGSTPAARVFDADGVEWKHIFTLNMQTGEAELAMRDLNGDMVLDDNRNVRRYTHKLPVPITVQWST